MKLDDLLNQYREELDETAAPELGHLFEEPVRPAATRYSRWFALAGLAAASVALAIWLRPAPASIPPPLARAVPTKPIEVPLIAAPPARLATRRAPRPEPQIQIAPFVAIAETEMLPEPRLYQVVRVSVDEERLVGLGLRDARLRPGTKVAAQVLLGDDGIARAIRVLGEERD
jgi:hypothetical protein